MDKVATKDFDESSCVSDAPTDGEMGYCTLPCYGHLADENSMDEAEEQPKLRMRKRNSARKGRVATSKTSPSDHGMIMEALGLSEDADEVSQAEMAKKLLNQNAMLALENKRLREQCEKAAAAAQAAAAAATAAATGATTPPTASTSLSESGAGESTCANFECTSTGSAAEPTQQMVVPQSYMGQWWSPVQMPFNMTTPMMMPACFVMPNQADMVPPQQQSRQRRKNGNLRPGAELQSIDAQPFAVDVDCPLEERTTVMLRNMPNNYNRKMLLQMMDGEGFAGQYNFVYMPIDFKSRASLGYAFINMVSPEAAQKFWGVFDGYSKWVLPSRKMSKVSWSSPHQGLQAHLERYKNSPLMHVDVPDDYRPILLENGVRVAFPTSTKRLRAPRLRHSPVERLNGGVFNPPASMHSAMPSRSRQIMWDAQDRAPADSLDVDFNGHADAAIMTDEEDFWF